MFPRSGLRFAGVLTLALLVGSGCSGMNRRSSGTVDGDSVSGGQGNPNLGPTLPAAPSFRIADIPIPSGFQFDRDGSYVYQDRDRELGSMRYVGKADVGQATQFFLDEMVQYNWTLVNVVEHQMVVLNFEKPERVCTVMISSAGRFSTEVRIDFRPRGMTAIQPGY